MGIEEIIGRAGVNAVLNLAETPSQGFSRLKEPALREESTKVADIAVGLEKFYGPRGGRGVALRAGRAGFKYLLRQYGAKMGIVDLNYRLLPVPLRLNTGLKALAGLLADMGDESVAVQEYDTHWIWREERCPHCWMRKVEGAACQFPVGLLQEFLTWASSGRIYGIREIECSAAGGMACVIQINKKALD